MKIVNLRNEKCDVKVDRSSIFGNPFHMGRDGNREDVIAKYRKYLWNCICKKNKIYDELVKISEMPDNTKLGCWCKPKACHGDVIVKAIEWLRKEN